MSPLTTTTLFLLFWKLNKGSKHGLLDWERKSRPMNWICKRSGSCKALFPSFIAEEVARKFRLGRLLILSLVLHFLPTLVVLSL